MVEFWSKNLLMQKTTVILTAEFLNYNSSLYTLAVNGKDLSRVHYDIEKRLSENGSYYDSCYLWKIPVKKNSRVGYSVGYKENAQISAQATFYSLSVYSETTQTNGVIDIMTEDVVFPLVLESAPFSIDFSQLNESENLQITVNGKVFNVPTHSDMQLRNSIYFHYYANPGETINYSFTDGIFKHSGTVTAPVDIRVYMKNMKIF